MGAKKVTPYQKKPSLTEDSVLERVKEWAEGNTRVAIGAGVVIVLLAVLAGGIVFYERSNQARTRTEYALIASTLPGKAQGSAAHWNKALPELQKFIADHSDSPSTLDARLELARGYFATKRYAEAAKAGREALSAAPRESSLRPLILYQLGYACELAGKPEEAAKAWTELKDLGVPALEREAYWNLGRIFQAKKQLPKAIEMYELASQARGAYPSGVQINSRLAAIKTTEGK